MHCIICQFLEWLIERESPGRVADLKQQVRAQEYRGLNSDALFQVETDQARLRELYELWEIDPGRAFSEFLALAEEGSVWSMQQVAAALESGLGGAVDPTRAEEWYRRAFERGSDMGLLRAGYLAFMRGAVDEARNILSGGAERGLAAAMRLLAEIELRVEGRYARSKARILFERAIELGDPIARVKFTRARAYGYFGLKEIPAGIRDIKPMLDALVD
jgi:TPR repeat protein